MEPRKLSLSIAKFSYGGNSGYPFYSAAVGDWLDRLLPALRDDRRVGEVRSSSFFESPVEYARNRAVLTARKAGADLLLMIDSDSQPDLLVGEEGNVPFWKAAFEFVYAHYDRGPVVVGAPCCTAPPEELVCVMRWRNMQSGGGNIDARLDKYTREEAAVLGGVQECAAIGNGLILYDMRLFDLVAPQLRLDQAISDLTGYWSRRLLGEGAEERIDETAIRSIVDQAMRARLNLDKSWFYNEYADETCTEKCLSEDVANTRDISLMGMERYGYNPVHCAWDSWCGHLKIKTVGKPVLWNAEGVTSKLARAIRDNPTPRGARLREVNFGGR